MTATNLCLCVLGPRCAHSDLSSGMRYIKNLSQNVSKFLLKTVSDFEGFGLTCSSSSALPELDPLKDGDFFSSDSHPKFICGQILSICS